MSGTRLAHRLESELKHFNDTTRVHSRQNQSLRARGLCASLSFCLSHELAGIQLKRLGDAPRIGFLHAQGRLHGYEIG